MDIFLITLISLWINPILGYVLMKFIKNKFRIYLILLFAFISILQLLSIVYEVSFTSINVDFIFASIFYLGISFYLWLLFYSNNKLLKIIGIALVILIFSLNYLLGTIGALGVGFAINNWKTSQEIKLEDNYIYKEISLGMALDDFRGKRIEIFKQFGSLPLEKKIMEKSYYNEIPWTITKLNVKYNKETKELYLQGVDITGNNKIEYWNDTIIIKQIRDYNRVN